MPRQIGHRSLLDKHAHLLHDGLSGALRARSCSSKHPAYFFSLLFLKQPVWVRRADQPLALQLLSAITMCVVYLHGQWLCAEHGHCPGKAAYFRTPGILVPAGEVVYPCHAPDDTCRIIVPDEPCFRVVMCPLCHEKRLKHLDEV